MTKKINLLLICLFLTLSTFVYLTIHHYSVKLGLSGSSICSINDKINCDAAAASSFAEVLGIPIAILGGIFTLFLFGIVFFIKMNWIEKSNYVLSTLRLMILSSALASLAMGLISLIFVKVICPFCTVSYFFSFINLYLGWNLFVLENKKDGFFLLNYFNEYKSHLIFLACIPLFSWISTGLIQDTYGLSEIKKIIPEKLYQWRSSAEYPFNQAEGLIHKGSQQKVTIVEFADFKCPHCKAMANTMELFLKGNPGVTFIYKPYPLDGSCNKALAANKGDGSRCTLAAWALCAEQTQQRGWDMHHWIFEKQDELSQVSDLKPYLASLEKDLKIDTQKLIACSESNETYELISRLANEGTQAQVEGTPTVYVNGKKLPAGQIFDVLQAAVNEVNR
ncbi:MAG: thioredoxin domain-containing protein [Pseudobdellovibrio sp.]